MADTLRAAIGSNQEAFGLELTHEQIGRLDAYYEIIEEHNPILHLVAPSSVEEFAVRHILESLTLLKHLPENSKLADVGAGAGLPSIPCLLVRDDLKGRLIESKEKKARFLTEAVERLGLADRAEVVNKQFIETHAANATQVTCRALDKFSDLLPRLIRWSGRRKVLLFGGPRLEEALRKLGVPFDAELMPMSTQRSLFVS